MRTAEIIFEQFVGEGKYGIDVEKRHVLEALEVYAREQIEASREIVDVLPIHSSGEGEICCEWFSCPKCNEQYTIKAPDNYCPICGVKLNWKL